MQEPFADRLSGNESKKTYQCRTDISMRETVKNAVTAQNANQRFDINDDLCEAEHCQAEIFSGNRLDYGSRPDMKRCERHMGMS